MLRFDSELQIFQRKVLHVERHHALGDTRPPSPITWEEQDRLFQSLDATKTPLELPTVPGGLKELQTTIAQIAKKLEKVPFDAIGANLNQALQIAR